MNVELASTVMPLAEVAETALPNVSLNPSIEGIESEVEIGKVVNSDPNLMRLTSSINPTDKETASISPLPLVNRVARFLTPDSINHHWEQGSQARFLASQKWEGEVISKSEETFIARLADITNPTAVPEEEAELPISDVSPEDLSLFEVGAHFYFSIGYHISQSGSYERSSVIRFRRLPKWSENQILNAYQRAEEKLRSFRVE